MNGVLLRDCYEWQNRRMDRNVCKERWLFVRVSAAHSVCIFRYAVETCCLQRQGNVFRWRDEVSLVTCLRPFDGIWPVIAVKAEKVQ
jgi:hypothetical protein